MTTKNIKVNQDYRLQDLQNMAKAKQTTIEALVPEIIETMIDKVLISVRQTATFEHRFNKEYRTLEVDLRFDIDSLLYDRKK